jgi:hypothetical protein
VLGGARAIEDGAKGTLQLIYDRGDDHRVLNSEDDFLHDIYQSLVLRRSIWTKMKSVGFESVFSADFIYIPFETTSSPRVIILSFVL